MLNRTVTDSAIFEIRLETADRGAAVASLLAHQVVKSLAKAKRNFFALIKELNGLDCGKS